MASCDWPGNYSGTMASTRPLVSIGKHYGTFLCLRECRLKFYYKYKGIPITRAWLFTDGYTASTFDLPVWVYNLIIDGLSSSSIGALYWMKRWIANNDTFSFDLKLELRISTDVRLLQIVLKWHNQVPL